MGVWGGALTTLKDPHFGAAWASSQDPDQKTPIFWCFLSNKSACLTKNVILKIFGSFDLTPLGRVFWRDPLP